MLERPPPDSRDDLQEGTEIAEDHVPTIDDDPDKPPVADYPDWSPDQTRVICWTNDPVKYPRDRYAATREEARAMTQLLHGRILQSQAVPGRWFFRVYRSRSI